MKAIVTVGVSASGKSTFARKWTSESPSTRVEINRDYVRADIMKSDGKEFSWSKWNWKREKDVTAICNKDIATCASKGIDIIISDTNLNDHFRTNLVNLLESHGYDVEIMDFPVSIEDAWSRDAARVNGVGHSVIAKQYQDWLVYTGRKVYTPNTSKLSCILVDIDGTLAHMNGKRGAFDWDKVDLDDVDEQVKLIVGYYRDSFPRKHVILLSGRDGSSRQLTEKWLEDNEIGYDDLFMREVGDMRKDTVVKEELFWNYIADYYNVQFVIDDRPSVCRMWRSLGLKVFQVGNPHIEF